VLDRHVGLGRPGTGQPAPVEHLGLKTQPVRSMT
jgi:hypothetical protein